MLYLVVFVTNASILIFEIAGARLLAPYLGTSVEVWAGTIAVILGGMAVGYWVAGIIADKHASRKMLSLLIFASACAALIAWGTRDLIPTLFASSHALPLTFTAMLTATLLFMPTTIILAAVSPFVAKALIVGLDSSARVVGRLNSIGTIGSIVGAIATSTLLIPYLGLDVILLGVALILFALSVLLAADRLLAKVLVAVIVGTFSLGFTFFPVAADDAIADISTTYNRIWVTEFPYAGQMVRAIQTDPFGIQCGTALKEGVLDSTDVTFSYLRGFELIARLTIPDDANALVLGGCNYSYPRAFVSSRPEASVTVVEIDPGMTQVAKEYFDFDPSAYPSLTIAHADARRFATADTKHYDVIFMDVFGSATNIPHHLTTKESFATLRDRMSKDGILVANIISAYAGPASDLVRAIHATASTAFPHVAFYSIGVSNPNKVQNLILVTSNEEIDLGTTVFDPSYPDIALTRIDDSYFSGGLVLTDDYAPVEYLTREIRKESF